MALVFKESNHISEEIKALPCFVNHLCEVERVTGGESHACFKVTLSKNDGEVCYFVKSFSGHQETAKAEVSVNLLAAEAGLAPAIIYYSPLWLVCEFIYGDSLAKFTAEKMVNKPKKIITLEPLFITTVSEEILGISFGIKKYIMVAGII